VVKEQSSLSFEITDEDIYYIQLSTFSQTSVQQIEDLLRRASSKEYRGIILDLRNNSGGLLNAVVEISGLFVKKGTLVVQTKDRDGNVTSQEMTRRAPIANGQVPIFVMTNNYTASAAEILAGFLKIKSMESTKSADGKPLNVFLVGTCTFGKGSVQEVEPISNDCAAKITTSLYYLPGDVTIQGTGIGPDFPVEKTLPQTEHMQWFTKHYGRESTLENYIKVTDKSTVLSNGTCPIDEDKKEEEKKDKDKPARWAERAKEMLQTDNQLRTTITLVNLFNLHKQMTEPDKVSRDGAVAFMEKQLVTKKKLEIVEVKL